VWKRVELIEQGLDERIVFAVGKHLRVSEAVLDDDVPGALYVYKRTMAPKAILERVEALAQRRVKPSRRKRR
jgi:3'-phosphoadenosine 5'-phosphosulfate sulfotransferase